MDNYATHKTKLIRNCLAKRPRWQVHFTPASASWINQVERFFALITDKQIRRSVHQSTKQLESDIRAFIDARNADPKPFRWTKSADDILAAIQRFCVRNTDIRRTSKSGHYARHLPLSTSLKGHRPDTGGLKGKEAVPPPPVC